jgi:dihydropyrimidinase
MQDFDLVIRGGTLVMAADTIQADLGIRNGIIAALGQDLAGREVLDATGKLVLPGAVDPHVHLEMPAGPTTSSDDWESGTIAAACGGTTTVIDFVEPEPHAEARSPRPYLLHAFESRRAQAQGRAAIDYGLHMTLSRADSDTLAQVPDVMAAGVPSFKTYTTYDGLRLNDDEFLRAMRAVKQAGGLLMVHAENHAMIEHLKREFISAGQVAPRYHPRSRPAAAEGEAIERVLALAEIVHVPVYVVHVSTARGADAIARARARGQAVLGETCPQYLVLTEAGYERPGFEGAKFVCSPPLRTAQDNAALWGALAQGGLATVGTDHCPFNYRGQKELGREQFTAIPGGLPGIEARLALMYTCGVCAGRLTLHRWVEVCCAAPARVFGLYPRKGTLMPGADADLVIFDPDKQVTLSQAILHEKVDYTPYEGFELRGYPVATVARGVVLVQDGCWVGPKGNGRYLTRGPLCTV